MYSTEISQRDLKVIMDSTKIERKHEQVIT